MSTASRVTSIFTATLLLLAAMAALETGAAQAGLTNYFDFDDGTGSTQLTELIEGNHGTLTNMDANSDWVAGVKGTALNFAGGVANSGQFVATSAMPTGMQFDGDEAFTWSGWINVTDATPGALMGVGNNGSGWQAGEKQFYMGNGSTGTVNGLVPNIVGWGNDWITPSSTQTVANNGQWHHVAIVHDNTGGADGHVYINGIEVASYARNGFGGDRNNVGGSVLRIGYTQQGESPENFQGSMDELGLFNDALSSGEVATIPAVLNEPSLNYGVGDANTLIEVFRTGTPNAVGLMNWTKAADGTFGGSEGDIVTGGATIGVIMNGNGGGVIANVIPEPSTGLLLLIGSAALFCVRRRRLRNSAR